MDLEDRAAVVAATIYVWNRDAVQPGPLRGHVRLVFNA
jgi:hypothetical protein